MNGENREPPAKPDIGWRLETARESRGLSLWQVEQETRIRSRYLRDLEREAFDVLPAVYVLGSLKTYADFLGLDGAALSRQLKARLVEPTEPNAPFQLAAPGGATEDGYEAALVPAVGFDRLFLGMGVILISILAIMTLATVVAQGDRSPVSQINQPSTPRDPSEIVLFGSVQDRDNGAEDGGTSTAGSKEGQLEDGPEASRGGEESKDEGGKDDQDASQASSIFGDAEFVPMSPSFSTTASASAASASAAPASAASASAASASAGPSSNPVPATHAPASTAATSAPTDASAPAAPEAPGALAQPPGAGSAPAAGGAPNGSGPRGGGTG